jgi:hypothetical protein
MIVSPSPIFLLMVLLLCMVCVFYHIFQSLQLILINVDYCSTESLVVLSEASNRKTNSKVVAFLLRKKSTAMKNNGSACMKCIICRIVLNIGDLVKFKVDKIVVAE